MKMRNAQHIAVWALLALSTVALGGVPNENSALGINLAGVTYWSSEIVFVDLFKHSQTFKSQAPGQRVRPGRPARSDAGRLGPLATRGRPVRRLDHPESAEARLPRGRVHLPLRG